MRLGAVRLIPALHESPALVRRVETVAGRLVLVLVFVLVLAMDLVGRSSFWALKVGGVLLLTSAFPKRRRALIAVAALLWIVIEPKDHGRMLFALANVWGSENAANFRLATVVSVLLFAWACFAAVRHFPDGTVGRRPVFWLVLFHCGLVAFAATVPLSPKLRIIVWAFTATLGGYLWFVAYSLKDANGKERRTFATELGGYYGFWGSTPTPWPKGSSYLSRVEAKDAHDLAVTQLKGLRLLLWAMLLEIAMLAFDWVVMGVRSPVSEAIDFLPTLKIPGLVPVLQASAQRRLVPWGLRWASLVSYFLDFMLNLAITSHVSIAICRMAGFRALRNMYRPLSATTIAEYFNRIYYYFKELLVEFFFFPTYLRWFRKRPRLRVFFATLAAAGLGNMIYHYLRDPIPILRMGLWQSMVHFQSYALYCLILGLAVGLSQLRHARRRSRHTGFAAVLASASVLLFYCLMIPLDSPAHLNVEQAAAFWWSLLIP